MPSSWKKVPLKCLLPPSSSLCDSTSISETRAIRAKYFPDWFLLHSPVCIVIHWVYAGSMSGLCYSLGFYELLMAARLHALTWRIWLLLFVSARSHCAACNRGQSDRGHCSFSKPELSTFPASEKYDEGIDILAKAWISFCRRRTPQLWVCLARKGG